MNIIPGLTLPAVPGAPSALPLSTYVYFQNNLSQSVPCGANVSPGLSNEYWGNYNSTAGECSTVPAYWLSRDVGIHWNDTWVFSTSFTLGGSGGRFPGEGHGHGNGQ